MSARDHIWRKEKAYIASLLEDYPNYQAYVDSRIYELEHPVGEIDENIGGGKAQFKEHNVVDNMLITIEEDHRLNELRREHYAIRACYDEADEDIQKICYELYFKKYNTRKYHTISDMCNGGALLLSQSAAYDKFDDFMHQLAMQLNLTR